MDLSRIDLDDIELEEYIAIIGDADGLSREEMVASILSALYFTDAFVDLCWGLDSTQLAQRLHFQFSSASGKVEAPAKSGRVDLAREGENFSQHNNMLEPSP